jgi:glycine/D-amino acid oxidase-like deaminating enzyme
LTIGTGGSGHGFKFGPLLGEMIATVAEGNSHKWSARYRWRNIDASIKIQEEARFKGK